MQEKKESFINDNRNLQYSEFLLSFDCWMKYIEGFTKGIQSTEVVNTSAVMDCIGEVLEYMTLLRTQLLTLLTHCESILEQNARFEEIFNNSQENDNVEENDEL